VDPEPNDRTTPEQMMVAARMTAVRFLAFPEAVRRSEMADLKASNPILASLVKNMLDDVRSGA